MAKAKTARKANGAGAQGTEEAAPKQHHMKWKARLLSALSHLGEKNPDHADAIKVVTKIVNKLDDDYSPKPRPIRHLGVGDTVTLPEMASIFEQMCVDNEGEIVSRAKGTVVVDVGGHELTVPSRSVRVVARAAA